MSTSEQLKSLSAAVGLPDQDPLAGFANGTCTLVGSPRHWFHLYFPSQPFNPCLEILVTGSRPEQAVQLAVANPECRITAVDSGSESLRHLAFLKDSYGLSNLIARELPLEDVEPLRQPFDLIFGSAEVCHEREPVKILHKLRGLLKPEGSMHLELLAPYGRRGMQVSRELARRIGVGVGEEGTENVRQLLDALSPQEGGSWRNDKLSLATILRPSEKTFDVAAALALLRESGLKFQRFMYQAHYSPSCSLLAGVPALLSEVADLPEDEQAAVMELFRGTMPSHELVTCRDDRPESSYRVTFEGRDWLQYVPIRNPGIEISRDGLPSGAIARLRWGSHAFPEIAALCDSGQARIFNALDDKSTSAEVLAAIGPKSDPAKVEPFARNFFLSM